MRNGFIGNFIPVKLSELSDLKDKFKHGELTINSCKLFYNNQELGEIILNRYPIKRFNPDYLSGFVYFNFNSKDYEVYAHYCSFLQGMEVLNFYNEIDGFIRGCISSHIKVTIQGEFNYKRNETEGFAAYVREIENREKIIEALTEDD